MKGETGRSLAFRGVSSRLRATMTQHLSDHTDLTRPVRHLSRELCATPEVCTTPEISRVR
jgi:hypothetical protein